MMIEEKAVLEPVFESFTIGNKAYILLTEDIGSEPGDIDGKAFASEVYGNRSLGRQVEVKINCFGGQVKEGWSMVDSIIETKANTFNAGYAYSMAGACLIAGAHRVSWPHGVVMIHAPRSKTGAPPTAHSEATREQFKNLLKSRTKFTDSEIEDMMTSGKDYFFTAKQALAKGIIDEILTTDKQFNLTSSQLSNEREMYLIYNKAIQEEFNQKNTDMDFKTILAKLTGKESEAEGIVAVTEMKSQNEQLKAKATELENEKKALEARVKTLEDAGKEVEAKSKATELVENAVRAGKVSYKDDAEKAKAIEGATANYDFAKQTFDAIPAKKDKSVASFVKEEKTEQMTYEYLSNNNPAKLQEIYNSDRELFDKLSDEYIAAEKAKQEKKN